MDLKTREAGGVTIVDAPAKITLGEGASVLREGLRELASTGHKNILINFGDVSVLDSTGLGVLVSSFATVGSAGGRLKLCNLGKRVKDVLVLTKLYTVFEVYDDEATACRSFGPLAAKV